MNPRQLAVRVLACAACVPLAGAVVLLPGATAQGAAGADPTGDGPTLSTFSGKASANAAYFLFAMPKFLIIENLVNGGGPTAQAALDSLGSSSGFASFPYPGDLGVAVPGMIATLSGKSVPTYPLVISSQHPSVPETSLDQPGYHLDSSSSEDAARSNAQAGARLAPSTDQVGSFAAASVVRDADTFASLAESRIDTQVGTVSIIGATSRAEVVVDNLGRTTKTSDFRVAGLAVNGIGIAVTGQGLEVVGTAQPAQKSMTIGTTTIRYVEALDTKDSVLAPGIQITTPMDVPAPVGRKVVVDFTIGRSFAQAVGASAPALTSSSEGVVGALPPESSASAPEGVATPDLTVASDAGAVLPTTSTAQAGTAQPAPQTIALVRGRPVLPTLSVYPFVFGGALVLLILSVGARVLTGVRRAWN